MGASYFILLERKIDGFNASFDGDGKWLCRMIGELDAAARQLGVRPLSEFFIDMTGADEMMEVEAINETGVKSPPLRYFSAADGLTTVKGLITRPVAHEVMDDLRDCERTLNEAATHGIGWVLTSDF